MEPTKLCSFPGPLNDQKFTEIKGSTELSGICINHHMAKEILLGYDTYK